jgi:hypothetical protein
LLLRWWGNSSGVARSFWVALATYLFASATWLHFMFFVIVERVIYEIGRRLAPTGDRSQLRLLASRHVKARQLRAAVVDRSSLLVKLTRLVERSGPFDIAAVLQPGAEFESLLDEWLATLRPGAANNALRQNFGEQLRARCKRAIAESQEHGARLAALLPEIASVREEIEKMIEGEGARLSASLAVNPVEVLLELKAWSESRKDSRAQLRAASERTLAVVLTELNAARFLFTDNATEATVDAWVGVSAKLPDAVDAVEAELTLLANETVPNALASNVHTCLIGACTTLRQEIEHWQAIAQRARACERALQAGPADVDVNLCIVCMEAGKSVMLEPCRHLNLCESCARNVAECPTCRVPVQDRKVVYF